MYTDINHLFYYIGLKIEICGVTPSGLALADDSQLPS